MGLPQLRHHGPGLIHGRSAWYKGSRATRCGLPGTSPAFAEFWFVETPRHPPARLAHQEVHYRKLHVRSFSRLPRSQAAVFRLGSAFQLRQLEESGNSDPATHNHVVCHRKPRRGVVGYACSSRRIAPAGSQAELVHAAGAHLSLLPSSGNMVLCLQKGVPSVNEGPDPSLVHHISPRLRRPFHICIPAATRDPCHLARQERLGQCHRSCSGRGSRHHPGSFGPHVSHFGKDSLLIP